MNLFFTELKSRFDSSAGATLKALASGGLWQIQAPNETTKPYIVMRPATAGTDGTMSGYYENPVIDFVIVVDDYSLSAGWSIRDALTSLYDDYLPTFSGGTNGHVMGCVRQIGGMCLKDPDDGYNIVVSYRYWFDEV